MGQMEMKCILYFYMNQGYSGERCGPWASCNLSLNSLFVFVFSSPELKAQVSFSDRPLSGVRLSVRL